MTILLNYTTMCGELIMQSLRLAEESPGSIEHSAR